VIEREREKVRECKGGGRGRGSGGKGIEVKGVWREKLEGRTEKENKKELRLGRRIGESEETGKRSQSGEGRGHGVGSVVEREATDRGK